MMSDDEADKVSAEILKKIRDPYYGQPWYIRTNPFLLPLIGITTLLVFVFAFGPHW